MKSPNQNLERDAVFLAILLQHITCPIYASAVDQQIHNDVKKRFNDLDGNRTVSIIVTQSQCYKMQELLELTWYTVVKLKLEMGLSALLISIHFLFSKQDEANVIIYRVSVAAVVCHPFHEQYSCYQQSLTFGSTQHKYRITV